ncbi:hypothetical protein BGX24_006913 [Mortierella sp. AD032]|nr:hypothetical protein BGX24_006913 [Mortierella sp. AD032]
MKVLVDAEKKRSSARQVTSSSSTTTAPLRRPSPLSQEQSHRSAIPIDEQQPVTASSSSHPSSTVTSLTNTSTALVLPPALEVVPVVPKLNTTSLMHYPDSASSSASSSPTLGSHDAVTFTFSSPLFYDQKLYIYHTLLALYKRMALCMEERPYSVALVHGFTVYLLSVVLSVAQLIMIAVTIENLDWIQSYKPLMCEWDSHFPGFVFPALDIESEEDDDDFHGSKTVSPVHKGGRYWQAQTTLKTGDDSVDDGYHSEESQQQLIARESMNSTLRKRLAKYQNWVPLLWSAEENSIQEASEETEEEQGSDETADHYSARIRRALVRTLSGGNFKPTKGKRRVTFNEQVMIFGRRRSSQVSQEFIAGAKSLMTSAAGGPSDAVISSMTSVPQEEQVSATSMATREQTSHSSAGPMIVSETSAAVPVDHEKLATLTHEEAEYQQRTASEDTNGSGTSSPTFTPTSPAESTSTTSTTSSSAVAKSVAAKAARESTDLRRSSSVPMKIGSFLSRHQNNSNSQGPKSTSPRHSSTFSESSTVSQNPRVLPNHLAPTPCSNAAAAPQQDNKQDSGSLRSSLSLGTRAKRSFSLALPRPNHNNSSADLATTTESNMDRGSGNKKNNKNFMYRIVHPQRYRRELEQQLTEQERQRLLALAHLQRDRILAADSLDGNARFSSSEAAAALRGANSILCGDPYYYATSAEYIEGLGAPNSMISTSFGTSFPEELQRHGRSTSGSKGRSKLPRPSSYDFDCRSVEVHTGATGACGYGSEGETSSSRMTGKKLDKAMSTGPPHGFFRRESKKKSEGIAVANDRTHSPNRLQQLFSHPGHKKSNSSSSSLDVVVNAAPNDAAAQDAVAPTNQTGGRANPPGFSSLTAANAHKLLSRARSNSRSFTTFTALGMPAYPPAQPMLQAQIAGAIPDHEMEHTSFAAFGFPSPTSSPVHSAPASPRHSTSSVAELHAHLSRQQQHQQPGVFAVASEEFVTHGVCVVETSEEYYYYHQQQVQEQMIQEQYYHQQQEVLLPEDGVKDHDDIYYLPSSTPVVGIEAAMVGDKGQDDGCLSLSSDNSRSSSRSSNHGQADFEGAGGVMVDGTGAGAGSAKRPRGLSFIRKLSLKKKK